MTEYRPGQVWEDNDGDHWKVLEDPTQMMGVDPNIFHGEIRLISYVEDRFGPLKLVSSPINLVDGSGSFISEAIYRDETQIAENDRQAFGYYITKDSGERAEFASGMRRDTNKGKPRFDLLWPRGIPYEKQPLYRLAMLMARGAEKYDDRNWELADPNGPEVARFDESGLRHYAQKIAGETDEDHAAAVLFNVMASMTMDAKREMENTT